ncbi:hypothetical protein INR49_000238, partial [Caranx melampygus]
WSQHTQHLQTISYTTCTNLKRSSRGTGAALHNLSSTNSTAEACLQCDRRVRILHEDLVLSAPTVADQIEMKKICDYAYETYRETSRQRKGVIDLTTLYRARTEYQSEFDRFLKTPRTGSVTFEAIQIMEKGKRILEKHLDAFIPNGLCPNKCGKFGLSSSATSIATQLDENDFKALVVTHDSSIVLNQLRVDEQGTYRCSLQHQDGTILYQVTFLLNVSPLPDQTRQPLLTLPSLPHGDKYLPFQSRKGMLVPVIAIVTALSLMVSMGLTVILGRSWVGCGVESSLCVVVDDRSRSVAELKTDSVAQMLLTALQNEVQAQVCFLQGGFEGVSEAYPELCYNSASSHLSTAEPEPVVTGRRTPAYDQRHPLLPQRDPGSSRHHSCAQCLLHLPQFYEGEFEYLRLTVEDSLAADIRACFSTAISFIDSVKQSGGRVLVHCQAGISRSATICLAYLMHTQRVRWMRPSTLLSSAVMSSLPIWPSWDSCCSLRPTFSAKDEGPIINEKKFI